MKINLDYIPTETNGEQSKFRDLRRDETGQEKEELVLLTLSLVARESLNCIDPNSKLSIESIMKKGKLIDKIRNKEDNFTLEEIGIIKVAIESNPTLRPYLIFQCLQALEPIAQ